VAVHSVYLSGQFLAAQDISKKGTYKSMTGEKGFSSTTALPL
jgi:hypothetical protein